MKLSHIFYINLEHRTDRKRDVEEQLKRVGLKGTRCNAVKMKDGRVGCTLSHIKCLEMAIKENFDHIFICEDDITFTRPNKFTNNLNMFLNNDKINWDVCIIAGNMIPPYQQIEKYCVKISRCQTTTGYIVKNHYFKTLLQNYKEGLEKLLREPNKHTEYAIDKYWFHLQLKHNWVFIIPPTVIQKEGYSDIEGKNINYANSMLDMEKKWLFKQNNKKENENIYGMKIL